MILNSIIFEHKFIQLKDVGIIFRPSILYLIRSVQVSGYLNQQVVFLQHIFQQSLFLLQGSTPTWPTSECEKCSETSAEILLFKQPDGTKSTSREAAIACSRLLSNLLSEEN